MPLKVVRRLQPVMSVLYCASNNPKRLEQEIQCLLHRAQVYSGFTRLNSFMPCPMRKLFGMRVAVIRTHSPRLFRATNK
jgi:hypothetical protein